MARPHLRRKFIKIIQSPFGLVVCLFLAFILCFCVRFFCKKKKNKKGQDAQTWSIPVVDNTQTHHSFFYNWDHRVKIVALLLFCFCVAALQQLWTAGIALLVSLLSVFFAQIAWQKIGKRLAALFGFFCMLLIILPLTTPTQANDVRFALPVFSSLSFSLYGLGFAFTLCVKACAIALITGVILGTASFADTLYALHKLGLPSVLCQIMLLAYRYIFLFMQESRRMYRSMMVRGFVAQTSWQTFRTMGDFFGMLFIRSFERTQAVYEAMLSRGYRGTIPHNITFSMSFHDVLKGGLWLCVSLLLVFFDRFFYFVL